MLSAVKKIIHHRSFVLVFLVLVLLTHFPASIVRFSADDYMQHAILGGSDTLFSLGFDVADPDQSISDRLTNGFHFFNSSTGSLDAQREYGNLPWWSVQSGVMQPYRPLAAATHWVDYTFFESDIYWVQWHSLVYFLLFSLGGFLLYKHLDTNPWVYVFAALMLVFDLSVMANLQWVAARNSYLAVGLGMFSLLWFIRWRETDRWHWLLLSLAMMIIGLLVAEATIAVMGYMGAYALFMDRKGWLKGCLAVIPFFLTVVVWRVLYSAGGFGAIGIGLYVDPGRDMIGFLEQLVVVIPMICFSQIIGIDDVIGGFSLDTWSTLRIISWSVIIVTLFFLRRFILSTPLAKFMLVGSVLAAVPLASLLSAGTRSGTFVAVGFFFVLALWLAPYLQSGASKGKRFFAWVVVSYHLIIPMLFAVLVATDIFKEKYVDSSGADSVNNELSSSRSLVIINHPAPNELFYLPYEWDFKGHTLPKKVKALVPGLSEFDLERVEDRSFVISSSYPLVLNHRINMTSSTGAVPASSQTHYARMLQGLITSPKSKMLTGDMLVQNDIRVTVLGVDDYDTPTKIQVEFLGDEDPNDMIWQWYDWEDKAFKRMNALSIGEVKHVKGPF